MDKGFCRDQQRPTEIIKSNIPINRDKSAGLIRLRAFFWIASVELELQQSFLRFPPFTIKKTTKPLVHTNVPIHPRRSAGRVGRFDERVRRKKGHTYVRTFFLAC